jgi:sigma-B regulation protein RsbU (phosphoserine phosphatase)
VAVGPVADRIRGRRLAAGQGIAGWVAKSGESVMAPDVSADPRFSGRVDWASSFVTHSILCAPLKTNQGTIGVVELLNRVDGHPFSRADLQLLETVALHAAAVIEVARLLERERELTALLASSDLTEELRGPLESLECCLLELINSAPQDPDMVATLEKAIERVGTIRQLSQRLSRTLPENSCNTTLSDR